MAMGDNTVSRRSLLRGRIGNDRRVVPPGFLGNRPEVCCDCTSCIDNCPTNVIVARDGWPALDFFRGDCTFCGECATMCPHTDALFAGAPRAFLHVAAINADCLPANGVDCQACRDHCPTDAIRFRPRLGGPFLPQIDEAACTGCGACITVCPVSAVSVKFQREAVHG